MECLDHVIRQKRVAMTPPFESRTAPSQGRNHDGGSLVFSFVVAVVRDRLLGTERLATGVI
jgi:hypothetical protein